MGFNPRYANVAHGFNPRAVADVAALRAALAIAWPHPERVLAPPPVVYRPCGAACRGGRLRVAPEGRKNTA
ncbi:MAG: hypothetical protein IJU72_03010, partial [Bacteroidales bacterium]|nr:hypothetical protein [Bacteroidales bacterium]